MSSKSLSFTSSITSASGGGLRTGSLSELAQYRCSFSELLAVQNFNTLRNLSSFGLRQNPAPSSFDDRFARSIVKLVRSGPKSSRDAWLLILFSSQSYHVKTCPSTSPSGFDSAGRKLHQPWVPLETSFWNTLSMVMLLEWMQLSWKERQSIMSMEVGLLSKFLCLKTS